MSWQHTHHTHIAAIETPLALSRKAPESPYATISATMLTSRLRPLSIRPDAWMAALAPLWMAAWRDHMRARL